MINMVKRGLGVAGPWNPNIVFTVIPSYMYTSKRSMSGAALRH